MNTNNYTRKTLEALQAAQKLAVEYQNQVLEQEHLLSALASQQDGLIPQLLQGMGIEPSAFVAAVTKSSARCPGSPAPAATRTRSMFPRQQTRPCWPPSGKQRP